MRLIGALALSVVALHRLTAAHAEEQTPGAAAEACVQVTEIGSPPDPFACLNARLRNAVKAARNGAERNLQLEGQAASAPATTFDLFNQTATHERLGAAFGHSAIPERPVQTYANPFTSNR